ncbi:hypothetical protein QBC46DRAFT_460248 [Diplogelasinospora grovesii]|uniref:Uncharacterized protein n=1 Tax=Diplogelasinospora grovesii TaxID=303347 RepID=A0AAN6S2R3_9PEZI|nr:hypothetical protein QBC46DRAFT_460248 [Diplogelasinospora grovesii]
MSTRQPLVRGGHLYDPPRAPKTFISSTLPEVYENTIIVAATHPTVRTSHAIHGDGWFLSDFYAFNYLLNGVGHPGDKDRNVPGQVWLTAAVLLHGNPYQTRKVVLSEPLLKAKQHTPVTVVRSSEMIDEFLKAVQKASELAKREEAPLLLLVFCHGLSNHQLLLDDGNQKKGLSINRLKGVIEPGCRATLVTTACYSGGWAISPDLKNTTLAAAAKNSTSNAWLPSGSMGRSCGSIFASTLIETLGRGRGRKLAPDDPTEVQTESYNQFCRSILEVCGARVHRMWEDQKFTFSAQNDDWEFSWTGRTGIPLARFEERWNLLPDFPYISTPGKSHPAVDPDPNNPFFAPTPVTSLTGGVIERRMSVAQDEDRFGLENTESIQRRAVEMARLLLQTCPGDWTQGRTVALRGRLEYFVGGNQGDREYGLTAEEVLSIVQFRWSMGLLADCIINIFGLPRPMNTTCMFWHELGWKHDMNQHKRIPDWSDRYSKIWQALRDAGLFIHPTEKQGPPFARFICYITAALVEADKSEDDTTAITEHIVAYFNQEKKSIQEKVYQAPRVRTSARKWLRTVVRRNSG